MQRGPCLLAGAAGAGRGSAGCCAELAWQAHWPWPRAAAPPAVQICPPPATALLQMSMQVVEAAPTMKGETAAPSYKRAVVEGGIEVRPPAWAWAVVAALLRWCCAVLLLCSLLLLSCSLLLRCVAAWCCAAAVGSCRRPTMAAAPTPTPLPCPIPAPLPPRVALADPGAAICASGRLGSGGHSGAHVCAERVTAVAFPGHASRSALSSAPVLLSLLLYLVP